jgi:DNA-binding NarL/FixJ family response regulator
MGPMSNQIFVIEDHPVVREGYTSMFEGEMGLEICGETGSAKEARRLVPDLDPDFAIVDLSLEDGSGLELIKDFHATSPELAILVVSIHDEQLYAERALRAGARGYLMKDEANSRVVEAVRKVLDGGLFLSPTLNKDLLLQYVRNEQPDSTSPLDPLSDRELGVFELMGQGLTRREIGDEISLSPKTIDSHRSSLKKKLSIDTNEELRRRAAIWVEMDA